MASPTPNPVTVVGLISASPGVGRTGAITNLAWILASADKKVLVLDWASEPPRVHDYLRPFHLGDLAATGLLGFRPDLLPGLDIAYPGSSVVTLRQYAVPAGARRVHVLAARHDDERFEPPEGPELTAWWTGLRELSYDYVLIDWPTDAAPEALSRVAELCDVVAVMFLPRRSAVEAAGEIAHKVAAATNPPTRIVPVPTQLDYRNETRIQRSRELIGSVFADRVPVAQSRHDAVEIPYFPYEDYDEALAVLVDDPSGGGTLLGAYERLAGAVTGKQVTALRPPSGSVRDRYRDRLGLPAPEHVRRIAVVYSVPNRPWADWARQRLTRAGAQVVMVSPETEPPPGEPVAGLVVISSPHLPESAAVERIARIIEAAGAEQPVDVFGLRVPDNRSEAEVGGELLSHFGLFDEPGAGGREPIRFPPDPGVPRLTNLLPRNESFVGREAELEAIRDRVTGPRGGGRWVLAGPPGVGKSQLAREYAHRFGYEYDLIWWIPAHRPLTIRAALARLAEVRPDAEEAGQPMLTALSDGSWFRRTLLIYDSAAQPETLPTLLPPGSESVDVLITATDPVRVPGAEILHIGPFDGKQGRDLLCGRVNGLLPADGERVAEALEGLPLALGLAAGWLRGSVEELRAQAATSAQSAELAAADFLARLARTDPGTTDLPETLARALAVVVETMTATPRGRLAVLLARLCAHLSPDGVGIDLLRSDAVLDRLRLRAGDDDAAPLRRDAEELDEVLWTGTSYGLFEVSWGRQAAVVPHQAVQALLRSAPPWTGLGELTDEDAQAALAAYAPNETAGGTPEARARFEELQRHLFPSGALHARDDAVRRWIVNHARHVYLTGDGETWRYAVEVAEDVARRWRAEFGEADELLLRLNGQIANVYRALGRHERAGEVDEATQDIQKRVLGLRHRQTLITTRGRAADLRSLGRFTDSYVEDLEAWQGFRAILGDDHKHTRMAAYNLATSAYLIGDVASALELQRDDHERLLRLRGPRNIDTWTSAARVGVWLRELGDYAGALELLAEVAEESRAFLDRRDSDVLWINWQLAIAWRRLDSPGLARRITETTSASFRELFGDDHPNTRGCTLSLAAAHHALGTAAPAVELARDCLAGYERDDPDHPFTAICRLDLALYLRGDGRLDEAAEHAEQAHDLLADRLGATHPWTLNAAVNRASLLAGRGELDAAVGLAEPTDIACQELLGIRHPYAVVSAHNLAMMRTGAAEGGWGEMDIDVLPI